MKLLIVVLNYNVTELTIDCLRSLAPLVDEVPGTGRRSFVPQLVDQPVDRHRLPRARQEDGQQTALGRWTERDLAMPAHDP